MTKEVHVNVGKCEEITLLEKIGPLDQQEWTPEVCTKCRRQNPQHTKLNCPCMSAACIARAVGPMGTSTSIGAQQGRRTWSVLARGMTVTIIPVLE